MKILGAGAVVAELRHTAQRVADDGRKVMHASAERILEQAKLQAPVDQGNLEESLRIERTTEYGTGRLELDIVVGDDDTDRYALIMHESTYNLGPKSVIKQENNPGVIVGDHFLSRAADEEKAKLEAKMIAAITKAIGL